MAKKTTALAGKIAIVCTAAMLAAGGAYTWRQSQAAVPELTTFVDHGTKPVVIGEEEVPLGAKPEVKKETKKSKKTVKLKKASKKTYTKKSKKTKTSTETKQNGNHQVVVKTTVVTDVKQKFKKDSKKKVIITKVTTITETSVQGAGQGMAQPQSSGQAGKVSISSIAPKLNPTVLKAYHALGFTVTIDPSVPYTGYFNAKNQAIILKRADDTIYIFLLLWREMWIRKQNFRRFTGKKAVSIPEIIRLTWQKTVPNILRNPSETIPWIRQD